MTQPRPGLERRDSLIAPFRVGLTAAGAVLAASGVAGCDAPLGSPEVFAPGEISGSLNLDAATFAPNRDTVFFDVALPPY